MRFRKYIYLIALFILFFCIGSSTKVVTYIGVLDRIEDDRAIILLETINQMIVIPRESLPVGSQENMWFNIDRVGQTYKVIAINDEVTREYQKESTHLMNKLRKIKGESKYKRVIESID